MAVYIQMEIETLRNLILDYASSIRYTGKENSYREVCKYLHLFRIDELPAGTHVDDYKDVDLIARIRYPNAGADYITRELE